MKGPKWPVFTPPATALCRRYAMVALDYHNARTFQDSVQGMFGEQVCRQAGGNAMIMNKTGERVCAIGLR